MREGEWKGGKENAWASRENMNPKASEFQLHQSPISCDFGQATFSFLGPQFPGGTSDKEPACQCRRCKRLRFDPWVRMMP